jgi:hypothetical protein
MNSENQEHRLDVFWIVARIVFWLLAVFAVVSLCKAQDRLQEESAASSDRSLNQSLESSNVYSPPRGDPLKTIHRTLRYVHCSASFADGLTAGKAISHGAVETGGGLNWIMPRRESLTPWRTAAATAEAVGLELILGYAWKKAGRRYEKILVIGVQAGLAGLAIRNSIKQAQIR